MEPSDVKKRIDKGEDSELFRLLQSSSALYADEMKTEILKNQFDFLYFSEFYKQVYDEDHLTLAGVLLFGKSVETLKPQFGIKATCYLTEDEYRDKEDIGGKLFEQHRKGVDFILRNLHRTQETDDFNSPGELEIPAVAVKEAVANALVHRDYFYNTSIFINVYADRVEVVSPGKLPNTVTLEGVKLGIHMERNPILLSFIAKNQEMEYTGRGSGIPRMIRLCKRRQTPLEFINDSQREQFRVIFRRKARVR
jgi:ATP-dependent DNA helicase RecG